MCRKALLTLRSLLRPAANIIAVTPLTTMPTAATAIISTPAAGCGCIRRSTASQAMAPVTSASSTALASAARIDEEARP